MLLFFFLTFIASSAWLFFLLKLLASRVILYSSSSKNSWYFSSVASSTRGWTISSIIGLTSCNNESPIIDKVDEIIEDATLELDYNSEYVDVSVIQSDEKIYSGKEIKLEVKVKDPLNYAFVYATLNNEKIEDLNKILLVKGTIFSSVFNL